jgi:hypothetical protein
MKHKHSGVIIHYRAVETNNTRFFPCTIITTKTRGVIRANNVPLSIIQFPRETTQTQRGNLTVEEANGGAVSFFPRVYEFRFRNSHHVWYIVRAGSPHIDQNPPISSASLPPPTTTTTTPLPLSVRWFTQLYPTMGVGIPSMISTALTGASG